MVHRSSPLPTLVYMPDKGPPITFLQGGQELVVIGTEVSVVIGTEVSVVIGKRVSAVVGTVVAGADLQLGSASKVGTTSVPFGEPSPRSLVNFSPLRFSAQAASGLSYSLSDIYMV